MPTDAPVNFRLTLTDGIAEVSLDRPEKKNPLTFESYAELRDWFRGLVYRDDVKVVIFGSNGGNFCSGGDVFEIIGPLLDKDMKGLLEFTRMTGDLVKAIIGCGKPVIAAVDGVCAGAGAIIAMCSDLRLATPEAKTAFLFNRVGLAGCDMGACAILPRIIGEARAAELFYTGDVIDAQTALDWGLVSRVVAGETLMDEARALAARVAAMPPYALRQAKNLMRQGRSISYDTALEMAANTQALMHLTDDHMEGIDALLEKRRPRFEGR